MTVQPKPWKRYCVRGHDTWFVGRTGGGHTCLECHRQRTRRKKQEERASLPPEFIPGLRPLRERRGFSLRSVAWEACLDFSLVSKIERCERRASYAERVAIYQAISVLSARVEEAREAERERERNLAGMGLA